MLVVGRRFQRRPAGAALRVARARPFPSLPPSPLTESRRLLCAAAVQAYAAAGRPSSSSSTAAAPAPAQTRTTSPRLVLWRSASVVHDSSNGQRYVLATALRAG